MKKFLFWTPRITSILLAIFLSIFAADVFGENYSFFQLLIALFMHLIPSLLIIVTLVISWKKEWIGGIVFIAIAAYYTISNWQKFPLSVFLLIPLPLFIIGAMFLLSWILKQKDSKQ